MSGVLALRVGPVGFRIASAWARPLAQLRALYAGYPGLPDGFAAASVRLEPAGLGRRWLRPSVAIAGDYTVAEALPLPLDQGLLAAEMGMNLQVALGWQRHVLLHASAVERSSRALLMVGASGSGKSTLAALLGEHDWRFMGDEFSLLDPASGRLFPFPRPVSLKNAAIAELEAVAAGDRFGPLLPATPKGAIRHLVPPADAIAAMDVPADPALILFPRFGEAPGLRAVPPAEAFMRLTESSTNYVLLGEPAFAALTDLVRRVPAVAVGYRSSAEGLAAVAALAGELGL